MRKIASSAFSFVTFFGALAVIAYAIVTQFGCTFTTTDQAEVGMRYSTSISFFHQANESNATGKTNLEFPSLMHWLFGDKETVSPSPTEPADTASVGGTPGGG